MFSILLIFEKLVNEENSRTDIPISQRETWLLSIAHSIPNRSIRLTFSATWIVGSTVSR